MRKRLAKKLYKKIAAWYYNAESDIVKGKAPKDWRADLALIKSAVKRDNEEWEKWMHQLQMETIDEIESITP